MFDCEAALSAPEKPGSLDGTGDSNVVGNDVG